MATSSRISAKSCRSTSRRASRPGPRAYERVRRIREDGLERKQVLLVIVDEEDVDLLAHTRVPSTRLHDVRADMLEWDDVVDCRRRRCRAAGIVRALRGGRVLDDRPAAARLDAPTALGAVRTRPGQQNGDERRPVGLGSGLEQNVDRRARRVHRRVSGQGEQAARLDQEMVVRRREIHRARARSSSCPPPPGPSAVCAAAAAPRAPARRRRSPGAAPPG